VEQRTLWSQLSFKPKVVNATMVIKGGSFLSPILSLPRRARNLISSMSPWTQILARLRFFNESDANESQNLREKQHMVNTVFLFTFLSLLTYNVLLSVPPDLVKGFTKAEDLCIKKSEEICGGNSVMAAFEGMDSFIKRSGDRICPDICDELIGDSNCNPICDLPDASLTEATATLLLKSMKEPKMMRNVT